jgi:Arylsulfatase regulator (Fe-S oxidoreductase)
MANIMLTDVCNLRCPYCFANEFVNKDNNEITMEAFAKAVDFIVGDGSHDLVGLIGGEPTLHSQFEVLLRKLIRDERVKTIGVYTNGILIDNYWDVIANPKVKLLINCNPASDIGEKRYARLLENLDRLILQKELKENVILGFNMYQPDFEYDYIVDLLVKYKLHLVRVATTVPNFDENRNLDAHSYFESMKPRMLDFFHELMKREILPLIDCNRMPSCLIKEDEMAELKNDFCNEYIKNNLGKSNIRDKTVQCIPVIDIRQDLTAVRCFGLSEYTKQRIEDFSSIKELENYYLRTIDAYAYNTTYSHKCIDCHERKVMNCMGGCLAFKINEILEMQNYSEKRMEMKDILQRN